MFYALPTAALAGPQLETVQWWGENILEGEKYMFGGLGTKIF